MGAVAYIASTCVLACRELSLLQKLGEDPRAGYLVGVF